MYIIIIFKYDSIEFKNDSYMYIKHKILTKCIICINMYRIYKTYFIHTICIKEACMAVKIAVANQKGGVGKTTTALALADGLRIRGKSVLLIDTDPQRNSTRVYGAQTDGVATLYDIIFSDYTADQCIQHTEYGDIIASDEQLQNADTQVRPSPKMYRFIRTALKKVERNYDYIIFDTPPRTGILLGNVLEAAEQVIVPVTCDIFGIQGLLDFYETIKEYQDDNDRLRILGLLKIKYKGRQNLTKDIEDNLLPEYAHQMNTKVFHTAIRESVKCQEAQTLRQSIFEYAPASTTAIDYNALIDEIMEG